MAHGLWEPCEVRLQALLMPLALRRPASSTASCLSHAIPEMVSIFENLKGTLHRFLSIARIWDAFPLKSISGYFWSTWEGLAAATDIHRCIIRNDQSSCWSPSPPLPHCKAVTERAALQVWHHAAAVIASSTCQTSKLKSTPNLKTFTWKPVIFLALIPNSTSLKVRRAHDYMSLSFSKQSNKITEEG